MAEFRHEFWPILIILLQRARVFGHRPEVHVALGVIVPAVGVKVSWAAARRCRPVEALRVQIGHQIATEIHQGFIIGPVHLRSLLPDSLIVIVDSLIVPAPKRDGGMALKPLDLMRNLGAHLPKELFRSRIHGAGEHEVVPDKKAQRVANLIETILFELASAPKPYHIHVCIPGRCEQIQIPLRSLLLLIRIAGDPVRSLGKNPISVHFKCKVLPHLDFAEADLFLQSLAIDTHAYIIEGLLPHPSRPPEFRLANIERLGYRIDTGPQRHRLMLNLLPAAELHIGRAPFRRKHLSN